MKALVAFLFTLGLAACGGEKEPEAVPPQYGAAPNAGHVYRFAVHPLHNPQKLHEVFNPLMQYLEARIPGARFEMEASRDYAAFEGKLKSREVAFALPNPYQALLAERHGYRIFAKMERDEDFRGILLVRRDSGIERVADLKGKTVAYPAPTALAAAMLPQHFLASRGLDMNQDIKNRYVGSQESSILAAYHRQAAAGATWPPPWRAFQKDHPKEAAQLRVAWRTPSLPNNAFVVRDDVPAAIADRVREVLLHMPEDAEGRAILAAMEFGAIVPADSATYEPVRRFALEFSARVRKIETYEPEIRR